MCAEIKIDAIPWCQAFAVHHAADTAFCMSISHLSVPCMAIPAASAGVLYAIPLWLDGDGRKFLCKKCGYTYHADCNASSNIENVGLKKLGPGPGMAN